MTTKEQIVGYVTLFPGVYTARELALEMGIAQGTVGRWIAALRTGGIIARPSPGAGASPLRLRWQR